MKKLWIKHQSLKVMIVILLAFTSIWGYNDSFVYAIEDERAGQNVQLKLAYNTSTINNTGANIGDTDLVHNIKSPNNFSVKYTLSIVLSGANFNTDELQIKLPNTLFFYRNSTSEGMKLTGAGITTNKTTAENNAELPLYYTISADKQELTIKNAKAINGAVTYNIEFEYQATPGRIVTGQIAQIQASCTLPDTSTLLSNSLSYTFNTVAKLESMSLSSAIYYSWPNQTNFKFPADAPAMDLTKYRYVSYAIQGKLPKEVDKFVVSQPYSLKVNLDLDNGGQLFYAVSTTPSNYIMSIKDAIDVADKSIKIVVDEKALVGSGYLNNTNYIIYAVVAYPVDSIVTNYKTKATLSLTPVDGTPAPTSLSKEIETSWADYNFVYPKASLIVDNQYNVPTDMGMFPLDHGIEHNLDTQIITVKGGYYPKSGEAATYGINIVSDLKYLADSSRTAAKDLVELTSDDVYIKNISLSLVNKEQSRLNGSLSNVKINDRFKDEEFKIYYRQDKSSPWGNEQTISFQDLQEVANWGEISYQLSITPPANMTQMKMELPAIFIDAIEAVVNLETCIKPTSPVYQQLRRLDDDKQEMTYYGFVGAVAKDSNNKVTTTISEGSYNSSAQSLGLPKYDLDNGGYIARPRDPFKKMNQSTADSYFKILQYPSSTDPTASVQDPDNQAVLRKFVAYGGQGYMEGFKGNILKNEAYYQQLLAAGLPNASLDKTSYFLLLPRGATLVVDGKYKPKFKSSSSPLAKNELEVNVISNNYKGTHCQLVELKSTSLDPGNNRTTSWTLPSSSDIGSGSARAGQGSYYDIDFYVSIPNSEASDIDNSRILGAFVIDKDVVGTGYADTGENLGSYNIMTDDGQSVFYNLGGKETPELDLLNTMNATSLLNCEPGASAYTHGLKNYVRPNDTSGIAKFNNEATVIPGQTYEYRLKLTNGQSTDLKNVILFNNLGQGSQADTKTWRGTFEKVDLSLLEQKGIKPVVYYTTVDNAPYFTLADITNASIPSEWSTVKPADDKDIHGIAIDVSKKADGTDFVMKEKNSLSVYITMKAPLTMPADGAAKELNFATYSATIGTTNILPDTDTSHTNNTVTNIVDAHLLKSSNKTERLNPKDSLTYTLEYENDTAFTQDVIIQDAAPNKTMFSQVPTQTVANPTVKIGTVDMSAAEIAACVEVNDATKEIKWNLTIPAKTKAIVTFDVVVAEGVTGEIENIATATIEDYSIESNKVVNPLAPILSKSGDPSAYNKDSYRYNITYINKESSLQKVVITDTLPSGTAFKKDESDHNPGLPTAKINNIDVAANWQIQGDKIIWTFDGVPAGSQIDVSFEVMIGDSVTSLENIANVTINNETVSYDSNKVETIVNPLPVLTKSYQNLTSGLIDAVNGDSIRYECVYKNESTQIQKVVIQDAAPMGTVLVNATDTTIIGNPIVKIDGVVVSLEPTLLNDEFVWTIENVHPNQIVSVSFDVMANDQEPTTIDNIASLYLNESNREFKSNLVRFNKTIKSEPDQPVSPDNPNQPTVPTDPSEPGIPPVNPELPNLPNQGGQDIVIESVSQDSLTPGTGDKTTMTIYVVGLSVSLLCLITIRKKLSRKC